MIERDRRATSVLAGAAMGPICGVDPMARTHEDEQPLGMATDVNPDDGKRL